MPFAKGQSGNPGGGPKGCGRRKALAALDRFLAKEESIAALVKYWADTLKTDPRQFFNEIYKPLLPKESILELQGGSEVGRGVLLAIAQALNGETPDTETPDDSRDPGNPAS